MHKEHPELSERHQAAVGVQPEPLTSSPFVLTAENNGPKSTGKNGRPRGFGTVYQRGQIWWIAYWWRGDQKRESSGSAKRIDAERLLKRRIQDLGKSRFVDPKAEERLRMSEVSML